MVGDVIDEVGSCHTGFFIGGGDTINSFKENFVSIPDFTYSLGAGLVYVSSQVWR